MIILWIEKEIKPNHWITFKNSTSYFLAPNKNQWKQYINLYLADILSMDARCGGNAKTMNSEKK